MSIRPSVLVVDDDAATRSLLIEILAAHGCHIIEASNGREAWSWLDAVRPDVILLDLEMPVMDGFQFLRAHREHADRRTIPVVVLSALPADGRFTDLSSVRFVAKPFTAEQVMAAIAAECSQFAV